MIARSRKRFAALSVFWLLASLLAARGGYGADEAKAKTEWPGAQEIQIPDLAYAPYGHPLVAYAKTGEARWWTFSRKAMKRLDLDTTGNLIVGYDYDTVEKRRPDGAVLWEITRKGKNPDPAVIAENVYVLWHWADPEAWDLNWLELSAYDRDGEIAWRRDLGAADPWDVAVDLMAAGEDGLFLIWGHRQVVQRFALDGELSWENPLTAAGLEKLSYIFPGAFDAADGSLYVHGYVGEPNSSRPVIIKIDAEGSIEWVHQVIDVNLVSVAGVRLTDSGRLYLFGRAGNGATGDRGYVMCLDTDGSVLWINTDVLQFLSYAFDGELDPAGNLVTVGSAAPSSETDGFIGTAKVDADGTVLWRRYLQPGVYWSEVAAPRRAELWGLAVDSDNNCYIHGVVFAGGDDKASLSALLVFATWKYDGDGNLLWLGDLVPDDCSHVRWTNDLPVDEILVYVAGGADVITNDRWDAPDGPDDDEDNGEHDNDQGCGC